MTEPRVEAGDRALETARKIHSYIFKLQGFDHADIHECHCCDELADEIQSAMNAQERELARTLNNLKCEVVGWLGLARPMLIRELSITNVRVMEHHVAEAERLLAERGEAR